MNSLEPMSLYALSFAFSAAARFTLTMRPGNPPLPLLFLIADTINGGLFGLMITLVGHENKYLPFALTPSQLLGASLAVSLAGPTFARKILETFLEGITKMLTGFNKSKK